MKKIFTLLLVSLFFVGCANRGYTLDNANRIYTTKFGRVIAVQNVTIKAGSSGSAIGGIIGLIVGSQIGEGKGNVAATLGGGLLGSLLGAQVDTPGQQLDIELDNGQTITTVIKTDSKHLFRPGDRVRLVLDGNKIVRIDLL